MLRFIEAATRRNPALHRRRKKHEAPEPKMRITSERESPPCRSRQQQRCTATGDAGHFLADASGLVNVFDCFKEKNGIKGSAPKWQGRRVGNHAAHTQPARRFVPERFNADRGVPPPGKCKLDCAVARANIEYSCGRRYECRENLTPALTLGIPRRDERVISIDESPVRRPESTVERTLDDVGVEERIAKTREESPKQLTGESKHTSLLNARRQFTTFDEQLHQPPASRISGARRKNRAPEDCWCWVPHPTTLCNAQEGRATQQSVRNARRHRWCPRSLLAGR
jgi:hypothetical protein